VVRNRSSECLPTHEQLTPVIRIGISSQLRTPLAALLGQIEIALRRERTPEQYRQALMVAQTGGGQLQRVIESLL
jgi:signal transduction histidine kinase